jgi:hypothetical protein
MLRSLCERQVSRIAMELTTSTVIKLSKNTYSAFSKIYEDRRQAKIKEFLNFIDLRYDTLKVEEQEKLNEHVNSDFGQEILSDYIDSIIKTSSKRARMAIALLFCKDSDFRVNEVETRSFVYAMRGMTDNLLNFFLEVANLETQTESIPYPRAGVHNSNFESFKDKGWDEEAIFININELIGLRLLLPDPKSYSVAAGNSEGWAIWFGITKTSSKMVGLILKATVLIKET